MPSQGAKATANTRDFENFAEIKNAWSAVDKVDKFTVFDF
jgi:hypothetical protein